MICISRAEHLPAYRTPCKTKSILNICDTLRRVIPVNPFMHNVEKWQTLCMKGLNMTLHSAQFLEYYHTKIVCYGSIKRKFFRAKSNLAVSSTKSASCFNA